MTLIEQAHSSQFWEWQNLDITTLKHAKCSQKVFKKLPEKQIATDFIYLTFSNFETISYKLLRPSQFLEKFMEILEWFIWQRQIMSLPLINVAGYLEE